MRLPAEADVRGPHARLQGSAPFTSWLVCHDFTFNFGGAERVTRALTRALAGSSVEYLAGEAGLAERMNPGARRLLPSWVGASNFRTLAPVLPALVAARAPWEGNLLASSYGFSHYRRVTGTKIVYCHSPLRQIWSGRGMYLQGLRGLRRHALRALTPPLRAADRRSARDATLYIATGEVVRRRVQEFYGRDAIVIPPPVDTDTFTPTGPVADGGDYYLWVGRVLEPYKRLSLVLEAFRAMPGRRLLVAGTGPDLPRLAAQAPSNVEFVGERTGADLAELYRGATGVIFPSNDDFGLVPLEAMACGTPVIAAPEGGALETVLADETGLFLDSITPAAVQLAVHRLERGHWDPSSIAHYAQARFSEAAFQARLLAVVGEHSVTEVYPDALPELSLAVS